MNIDLFIIILAIVQIITLICFFILCSNVAAIRRNAVSPQNLEASFNLYYSTGQIEKARELLMMSIKNDSEFATAFYLNSSYKEDAQKHIEKKYGKLLELVELKIDFDKANDFIAKF